MSEVAGPPGAKPLPAPGSLGAWILAARPKTLVAGWAPVLTGSVLGGWGDWMGHPLSLTRMGAALLVALGIQVGTNLVNDAADSRRGADSAGRLGPPRAVAEGLLSERVAMTGGMVCFAIAAVAGLWLASVAGWWLLVPGALAIAAGYFYTAGPKPLAYLGLGEVFVFIFFGLFATAGSAYLQLTASHYFLGEPVNQLGFALWLGSALGLFSVAILQVNNIRDAPTDKLVGKKTLAVRLGDRGARHLYAAVMCSAFLLYEISAVVAAIRQAQWFRYAPGWGWRGLTLVILPMLAFPLAIKPVRSVLDGATGRALNPVLGATVRTLSVFAILVTVSFLIAWRLPTYRGIVM